MTTIKILSNQGEAALLLSVLQDNEYDAVLLHEGPFQFPPVTATMRLQVPDEQAAAALTFLSTTPELQPGFIPADAEPNDNRLGGPLKRIDTRVQRPPVAVVVATVCLALSHTIALVTWVVRKPFEPWILTAACLCLSLMLYTLYRGWTFMRMLVVIMIVTGLLGVMATFTHLRSMAADPLLVAETILLFATAILLMLPAANRWFSNDREA